MKERLSEEEAERYVGVDGGDPMLIGQGGMGRVVAVFDTHLGRAVARKELARVASRASEETWREPEHPSLDELIEQPPEPLVAAHLEDCPACRVELKLFREAFGEVETEPATAPSARVAFLGAPTIEERFLQEARVTARLEHPSIVPVYELGRRPDGSLYYTMKLVRGRTLSEAVAACGDLPERLALLGHFVALCQGVAYAHSRGVVHRDLKPQNVMLGEFGETVLLDWGLARVMGERDPRRRALDPEELAGWASSGHTVDGSVMGTLRYMSPEQARGEVAAMDALSDTWSLGAVLFEVLTGEPPYRAGDAGALLERARTGRVLDPLAVCPELPPELAAVARRAHAADRSARYPSAAPLAAEVEAWRVGRRVSAYDYSTAELLRRFAAEHRRPLAVAAVAAALLAAVAASAYLRVIAERDRAVDAEQVMEIALRGEALRSLTLEAAHREREGRPSLALPLLRAAAALDAELPAGLEGWDGEARIARLADRQVTSLVLPHPEPARALAWSPDGLLLATASDVVRVWGARDGLARALPGSRGAAGIGFAADGALLFAGVEGDRVLAWEARAGEARLELEVEGGHGVPTLASAAPTLVTAGGGGELLVWDAASGARLATLGAPGAPATALALSPDGRWLSAGFADGRLELWDLPARALARRETGGAPIAIAAVSDDGGAFAGGTAGGAAWLWSSRAEAPVAEIHHFQDRPTSTLAFGPGGRRLAVASLAGGIGLWGEASPDALWSSWVTDGPTRHAAFSPDGDLLAVASTDTRLRVMRASDGAVIAYLEGHERGLRAAAWSPDGERLASAGEGLTVRIWRRPAANLVHDLRVDGVRALAAAWSPLGDRVATAHIDGVARIWAADSGRLMHEVGEPGEPLWGVRFSPDGRHLASEGRAIRITDARSGETLHTLGDARASRWSQLRFSPDGRELAASRYGNPPERWGVADGSLRLVRDDASGPRHLSMSVAYAPDGSALAVGDTRGVITLWDTATDARLRTLRGWGKNVPDLAFSPSGDLLAACYTLYNQVLIWDPRAGEIARTLEGHSQTVGSLDFSPDGALLVTGSLDGTARIWDPRPRAAINRLDHGAPVWRVAFTPDGAGVITAASPVELNVPGESTEAPEALDTARLWDARSGQQRRAFPGHGGGVIDVAVSPSGARLAAVSHEGHVRIWSTGLAETGGAIEAGAQTNLRVCRADHRVVPVLPFPPPESAWAPDAACE